MLRRFGAQHVALIVVIVTLAGLLLGFAGCQGLPSNVANCAVTPTPPADLSVVPPAPEPPSPALCGFPLTISSPNTGASVNSPVPLVATATPPDPIYTVRVYVDGQAVLYTPNTTVNQLLWMANGQHTVEVVAEDTAGYIATSSIQLNVIGQEPGALNIQDQNSWVSCSATISNSTCAAGLGTATSTLTLHQSSPSLDGSAAKFSIAGNHPYSNELYWIPLGGGNSVSHFTYDLWFYVDQGDAPQSLEFDVNQAFGGTRWTWGSQCDFNQTHHWNVWDPLHEVWVPIPVPCNHFPSNTWVHLIWTLERVGNQVHYITLNVADQTYNVDTYFTAQPNWYQEEIDIAFQMDGNYKQQPFSVWLDEVNLLVSTKGGFMPERETIERARDDAREGKSPSTQAGEFVREEMHHIREGKHGAASTKQAIAIGLSKARRSGVKLSPPRAGKTSASTRQKAESDYRKGQSHSRRRPSATRSRATSNALKKKGRSAASSASLSKQARTAAHNRGSSLRRSAARKASRTRKHARA